MTQSDPTPFPIDHVIEHGGDADPALALRDGTLSYADLRTRVGRLAAWLKSQIPEAGARIASWSAKGELTCLLPLAAPRAGLVHVPINPMLKRAQVAHILADSGAAMLIGTPARLSTLEQDDLPAGCAQVEESAALEAAKACDPLPKSAADPQTIAAILYTSGSTGKPKGVVLSHANLWLGAVSVAHYLKLRSDDVTLAVLPLAFDYGQNQLLSTWRAGGCVAPLDYLMPRDVTKAVAKHRATTLAAVPPLWRQLVEAKWEEGAGDSLKRLTNSGGALTPDLIDAMRATWPAADIYPMYGLTEAFRSTFLDPGLVATHPTSMGKAVPFAEVLVVNEAGGPAAPGEEGELVHCGPLVAQGYWQDPERTAERYKPAPAHSEYGGMAVWSGDYVKRDADGLLYFVGRRDAMIKSAGNRISPQEIEDAALATGLVADAVAFGVADAKLGQAVHLVVRGAGEVDALKAALKRDLPSFMQPHAIEWREDLPLNPNGKIDRPALFREVSERLAA
ncbi:MULTISPECIES: acyl-CoA ligase (AMP-forming), exosortase A system-associated [Citromicrobium]|uniref:acyl-CoA ligase (AMP-forming), exosortase A system-associated n=1 Tax=Citromicrobium TaxID=72173 RepID=UPI0001DD0A9C|nr:MULTISPECIES: acyl-CoA ligase (AMP-forming), exosortase A system-associated [Citromicrobium]ALG61315.1 AMP-binding protein [Citromicrobium sp. JL477]KPM12614.1 AMP-binding protein [Citromicrobium sp. JL1351]KPM13549.1 AMP-binding protein [Citromicrobium sp. JL31]KPM21506.1 AMP-binding protein [Citromicrobium sp. JL2201]